MNFKRPYLINRIWLASQQKEAKLFAKNIPNFGQEQQRIVRRYLTDNASTEYGQTHAFGGISDYRAFCQKVPLLQEWEKDMVPYIDKIAAGTPHVLTRQAVGAFEETSGTSGFAKLIPYTENLKQEFQRAVAVWMTALWQQNPAAFRGRSYWTLSPALKPASVTEGGVPIGLENDTDYFNFLTAWALQKTLAVPASVKKETETKAFYTKSLGYLLAAADLSFISVWSPTFLLQLDTFLQNHFAEILAGSGGLISSRRKAELQRMSKGTWVWKDLWPGLATISCWTDAHSAIWIPRLNERAGAVTISPKGLLSTECVVSIPCAGAADPVLSYRSHFYEFRELASDEIVLAEQLQREKSYEVIVTTGGGLYRYATRDVVEITGFLDKLPQMKFVGRNSRQSDLVGEKLSEYQVQEAIARLHATVVDQCQLLFVYPYQKNAGQAGYKLCFLPAPETDALRIADELREVEKTLHENPYYRQAVRAGQLAPLAIVCLPAGFDEVLLDFYKTKKQLRDGTAKLPLLFEFGFLDELNL